MITALVFLFSFWLFMSVILFIGIHIALVIAPFPEVREWTTFGIAFVSVTWPYWLIEVLRARSS